MGLPKQNKHFFISLWDGGGCLLNNGKGPKEDWRGKKCVFINKKTFGIYCKFTVNSEYVQVFLLIICKLTIE